MRNIPAEALAVIAQTKGLEPVNLIRVQWAIGGQYYYYADRSITGVPYIEGNLLTLADLEAVLNIDKAGTSTTVRIELDDTNGVIKSLFDVNDIHGRPVAIMQWFSNLALSSAFVIFEGSIASPIEWSEGNRTLAFDVMTRIEDVQAGFTIEDGQFTSIPRILVGKSWPLVFGTVLDIPTLQMDEIPSGTTRVDIGIPDENINRQAQYHIGEGNCMIGKGICLSLRGAELQLQAFLASGKRKIELENRGRQLQNQSHKMQLQGQAQLLQGNRLNTIKIDQHKYDLAIIPIINGHLFLQNTTICININGGLFSGHFSGDNFFVGARQAPQEAVPKIPISGTIAADTAIATRLVQQRQADVDRQIAQINAAAQQDIYEILDPDGNGLSSNQTDWTSENYWACNAPWFLCSAPAEQTGVGVGLHKDKEFWYAAAGSSVNVGNNYPIRYILSIIPNTTVLWLSGRRTVNGLKIITPIPPNFYTLSTLVLGGVIALIATFHQPMSTLKTVNNDLDWEDEIFATLTSSIGPNVVDEMTYIIQRWTAYGIDSVSFNYVRTKVDLYPANFALLEKKNVVQLLQDMAFQSRCAIWLADNVWHLKYLPEQGSAIDTITEDDIEQQTLTISTTGTEDLVTRYIATWRQSYAISELNRLIFQYNINKYGVHEETYDYYIYNTEELVYKSAIFWLIRKANVWKTIKCRTFLTKLKVETLDNINVNLAHNFSHYGNVVGSVNKATYNSAEFAIDMEIWLPVRLGEMVQYEYAYPAGLSVLALWPTSKDIAGQFTSSSYAPSQGTGSLAGNNPNVPVKSGINNGTAQQSHPSDQHDQQHPPPIITETTSKLSPNYATAVVTGNTAGRLSPRYDYVNRPVQSVPFVADVHATVASRMIPGYLSNKIGNRTYSGVIFPNGLGGTPQNLAEINILDISPDEIIPENTWGLIQYQPETDSTGKTVSKYYYQPAIWNPARADAGDAPVDDNPMTGLIPNEAGGENDTTTNPDAGTGDGTDE